MRWLLPVFAMIVAGCRDDSGIPPPDQLAERIEPVREEIFELAGVLGQGEAADGLAALDAALESIAGRYGANSVAAQQAVTEAGLLLLANGKRYDLAERYFERALELSRLVFGTHHRETGYALHDLAIVRDRVQPEPLQERAGPLMREAIEVRRSVLGPDHKETAASEAALAGMLLAAWRRRTGAGPASPLLAEADELVARALPALDHSLGRWNVEVTQLRYLQVEIALARQSYRRAAALARELRTRHFQPCSPGSRSPDAWQLEAAALRALGRDADATALERAAAGAECAVPVAG